MSLKTEMQSHLLNDILPYWMLRTIDPTQQSTATYDVGLQTRGNFD